MKKTKLLMCLLFTFSTISCMDLVDPFGIVQNAVDETDSSSSDETPIVEATKTYYLALGGVDWGRDELVIYNEDGSIKDFAGQTLTFETDDIDVVDFSYREDYDSFEAGSGALLDTYKCGVAYIYHYIDGVKQEDIFKVVVAPQSLIKILIGEARGQLQSEAETDDNGNVKLTSTSITGRAVASVVKNRIDLIDGENNPGLFKNVKVNSSDYYYDEPCSKYDTVVNAHDEILGVYQFSPVNPNDSSYTYFDAASSRGGMGTLEEDYLKAYDQAVLTAGRVFAGDVNDPTNGAFAFRSPNEDQWILIENALNSGTTEIPYGIGTGDGVFPAYAPTQVLVHPDVATYEDGRTTFIFTRQKLGEDNSLPAITNVP